MAKILIGICNMGNGHISRQSCVISALKEHGHDLLLVIGKNHEDLIRTSFPDLPYVVSSRAYIFNNERGTNFRSTYERYLKDKVDYNIVFLETAIAIEDYFKGKPDLVIEDYDPIVGKYAYLEQIPLICMEQQAKFIYTENLPIEGYSINEEICRLEYFFPRFEKRILSSFFPLEINSEKVAVIPPIIEEIPKVYPENSRKIIIYLSPFSEDTVFYGRILNAIAECKDYDFHVYTNMSFGNHFADNFIFHPISNGFRTALSDAFMVLATSGHQLISEALSLNLPVLLLPMGTYEQHYNTLMVEKNGLGKLFSEPYADNLRHFIDNRDSYVSNISTFKKKYWSCGWYDILMPLIERYL